MHSFPDPSKDRFPFIINDHDVIDSQGIQLAGGEERSSDPTIRSQGKASLYQHLLTVLGQVEDYRAKDGSLLRQAVINDAENLSERLLDVVLYDDVLKTHFSVPYKDGLVIDKSRLLAFLTSKDFLQDTSLTIEPAEANRQKLIAAYHRGELDMSSLIFQLDTLQKKDIKGKGVIYTPVSVVHKLIEISNATPFDTILEPSCGHGAFIFGLLDHAKRAWGLSGKSLLTWFKTKVTAVDISETAVTELRELLTVYFALEHQHTTGATFHNVFVADTLFHTFQQRFNICIGNPPYVRTQNLEEPYLAKVRARYATCAKGNVDLYYAFIEMASAVAARVTFITPNSFLSNASAKKLRALMEPRLNTLIDFKEKLVFPDARTYTCIFSLGAESETYSYSNDFDSPLELRAKLTPGASHENGATVLSGLATLCDAAFRVQKIGKSFTASHEGLQFEIEEGLIVPYFKLTKHRPDSPVDAFMIYPYRADKSVIPEEELKRLYPKAYKYLLKVKPRLLMRDRGVTEGYEAWYAYGRKQGLHAITAREVLVIPQMVGQACQPFTLNIGRLVSRYGTVVFSAGYLVPVEPNNKELIEFIRDSERFRAYLVINGKPWPGKSEPYYSVTAKQLRQVNFQIED